MKDCIKYALYVVMLLETGFNDHCIYGCIKVNTPLDHRGDAAIYVHQDIIIVKTDSMQVV